MRGNTSRKIQEIIARRRERGVVEGGGRGEYAVVNGLYLNVGGF